MWGLIQDYLIRSQWLSSPGLLPREKILLTNQMTGVVW